MPGLHLTLRTTHRNALSLRTLSSSFDHKDVQEAALTFRFDDESLSPRFGSTSFLVASRA